MACQCCHSTHLSVAQSQYLRQERPVVTPGVFTLQVVSTLLQQAGTGQTHEHTLLLVFGDHGQTLTGEHGGGTPQETDSALLAVHLGALHALRLVEAAPK